MKAINRIFILSCLMCLSAVTIGQTVIKLKQSPAVFNETEVHIDSVAFLLGTLIGKATNDSIIVDYYKKWEQALRYFMKNFINEQFNVIIDSGLVGNMVVLKSEKISILTCSYQNDRELFDKSFKSNTSKCSYILGAYLRHGERIDSNIIHVVLHNKIKAENIYHFLKDIGCDLVIYKLTPNIPYSYHLYFKPTAELYFYFNKWDNLKMAIINNKKAGWIEKFGIDLASKIDSSKNLHYSNVIECLKTMKIY